MPTNRLRSRHAFFAQLSLAPAIGFLLLIPLQASSALRQGINLQQVQITRIANAEKQLAPMRQSAVIATSGRDLNRRLQDLNGPVIGPADVAEPPPLLKAQVDAVLDQAALQIRRERQQNPPIRSLSLLPGLLRNSLSCLALVFTALSRRPGAYRSRLVELQSALQRRSVYKQARRRSNPLLDLLDRISLLWTR